MFRIIGVSAKCRASAFFTTVWSKFSHLVECRTLKSLALSFPEKPPPDLAQMLPPPAGGLSDAALHGRHCSSQSMKRSMKANRLPRFQ